MSTRNMCSIPQVSACVLGLSDSSIVLLFRKLFSLGVEEDGVGSSPDVLLELGVEVEREGSSSLLYSSAYLSGCLPFNSPLNRKVPPYILRI